MSEGKKRGRLDDQRQPKADVKRQVISSQSTQGGSAAQTPAVLQRGLGPAYVSKRVGPGGIKVPYLQGGDAIFLANEFFGNAYWSSRLVHRDVECRQEPDKKWICDAVYVSEVKVTWSDLGVTNSHEGTGAGGGKKRTTRMEALEEAVKEAETDSVKRALRFYGEATGNCLYDPDFRLHVERIRKNVDAVNPMERWPLDSLVHKSPQAASFGACLSTPGSARSGPSSDNPSIYDNKEVEFDEDEIFVEDDGF